MNDKRISIDVEAEVGREFKTLCAVERKTQKEVLLAMITAWIRKRKGGS